MLLFVGLIRVAASTMHVEVGESGETEGTSDEEHNLA